MLFLRAVPKPSFLEATKIPNLAAHTKQIFLDWLTQHNDCYVTAHDVDCHHQHSVQEQVEVPVVPLGHTVTNL